MKYLILVVLLIGYQKKPTPGIIIEPEKLSWKNYKDRKSPDWKDAATTTLLEIKQSHDKDVKRGQQLFYVCLSFDTLNSWADKSRFKKWSANQVNRLFKHELFHYKQAIAQAMELNKRLQRPEFQTSESAIKEFRIWKVANAAEDTLYDKRTDHGRKYIQQDSCQNSISRRLKKFSDYLWHCH